MKFTSPILAVCSAILPAISAHRHLVLPVAAPVLLAILSSTMFAKPAPLAALPATNQQTLVLPATRPTITLSTMANAMEYAQIAVTTSILSISSVRHAR